MHVSGEAKPRVLCALTDTDVCELVTLLLPDFEIISVKTISDATLKLAAHECVLVICGYAFLDGTWLELCEMVRMQDPKIPIIALSGTTELLQSELRAAGGTTRVSYSGSSWPTELKAAVQDLSGNPTRPA